MGGLKLSISKQSDFYSCVNLFNDVLWALNSLNLNTLKASMLTNNGLVPIRCCQSATEKSNDLGQHQ